MAYTKAKEGITINNQFVLFVVEPIDQVVDQVREMDTGLKVPATKRIIS